VLIGRTTPSCHWRRNIYTQSYRTSFCTPKLLPCLLSLVSWSPSMCPFYSNVIQRTTTTTFCDGSHPITHSQRCDVCWVLSRWTWMPMDVTFYLLEDLTSTGSSWTCVWKSMTLLHTRGILVWCKIRQIAGSIQGPWARDSQTLQPITHSQSLWPHICQHTQPTLSEKRLWHLYDLHDVCLVSCGVRQNVSDHGPDLRIFESCLSHVTKCICKTTVVRG
jgi:hypothetical protein